MDMYFLVHLIGTYGYDLILIGSFLEGETVALIGGALARNGPLFLPYVWMAAFLGSFIGDQLFFWLGKKAGQKFISKHQKLQDSVVKMQNAIAGYDSVIILSFRFLYGMRIITPFLLGCLNVSGIKFLILNFIGACVWAGILSGIGYAFANAISSLLSQNGFIHIMFLLIITVFILLIFGRIFWQKKEEKK